MTLEKDKKIHETEVGEFWFDEKTNSLHIKSRTDVSQLTFEAPCGANLS